MIYEDHTVASSDAYSIFHVSKASYEVFPIVNSLDYIKENKA